MMELNLFESMDALEPKCPGCNTVIEYDVTTRFSDKKNAHVCLKCSKVLN